MNAVEIRKEVRVRPCYCPRNKWGDRKCGHAHGIAETYWVVVIDGRQTSERYSRKRDAVAAVQQST